MKKNKILTTITIIMIIATIVFPTFVKATDLSEEITLSGDITDGIVIKSGTTVILNLNGKTITNTTGGDTIKIEEGASLTIKGKGTVTNDTHGKAVIYNEGTLVIDGGMYTRSESKGKAYYTILNHGFTTLNGGTIRIESNETGDWNSSVIDNGWVKREENTKGTRAVLVINSGATVEIAGKSNKYIKNDDFGMLTVNGGTFNSSENTSATICNIGEDATLTINGGTFNCKNKNQPIWVVNGKCKIFGGTYNLPENSLGISDPEISNFIPNSTEDSSEKIGSFNVLDENGNETEKKVIVKENELKEKVETKLVDESSIDQIESQAIEKVLKEKLKENYTIVGYYDIDVYKTLSDNTKVQKVEESSNLVKVTLDVPRTIEKVKEGYKRTYYIVRVHNGVTEILDAIDNNNGTITFESDKFSTYSLTYVDKVIAVAPTTPSTQTSTTSVGGNTETTTVANNSQTVSSQNTATNPNTGDTIVLYIVIFAISLIGAIVTFVINKRK